jgi:hypothetical protein
VLFVLVRGTIAFGVQGPGEGTCGPARS